MGNSTSAAAAQPPAYPEPGLLIDGEWIHDRPAFVDVENPSTQAVLGRVPSAQDDDIDRTLAAAQRGFDQWRRVPLLERAELLQKTAALMRERAERIATVITLEQGKPLAHARGEVVRSASFLEWDAAQLQRTYGRVVPSDYPMHQRVVREPVGPVAAFTPWNVPISAPARKLSGAIAAGCSIVIKPAEETPSSTCLFAQCFVDAGLPDGVLNVLFGDPAHISSRLVSSPTIRMITLTGSVRVGKQLAGLAAEGMKPMLMELGGHAPVLIDSDVTPSKVAEMAVTAKFRMAGQLCVSPSRFLVHRDIYDDFVREFAHQTANLKVADGFVDGADMGPVANARCMDTVSRLVEDARSHGARVVQGGERIGETGYFYAPTILADVPMEAEVMSIEPFGPLAACLPVSDMQSALDIANSLEVGLAGYIFSNSTERANYCANELQCGSVAINNFGSPAANAPMGGYKESGIGREGGEESLDSYTVSKTILQRMETI